MYEVGFISKSLASTPASFCSDVSEVEDDHRGMSSFDSCTKQSARKPWCSVESHDDKIEKLRCLQKIWPWQQFFRPLLLLSRNTLKPQQRFWRSYFFSILFYNFCLFYCACNEFKTSFPLFYFIYIKIYILNYNFISVYFFFVYVIYKFLAKLWGFC